MKRFQNLSKYRNSVVSAVNRDEWFNFQPQTINTSTSDPCPIACSNTQVAFRQGQGSTVGVVNLADVGRPAYTTLHHGSQITGLEYIEDLIISSADDGTVKLFREDSIDTMCHFSKRIECLAPSPSCAQLTALASSSAVSVWDISTKSQLFEVTAGDVVQQITWYQTLTTGNKTVAHLPPSRKTISSVYSTRDALPTQVTYILT
jgi:WD40 repeat protein